jgi:glycolate oxidase FAD binding subunit
MERLTFGVPDAAGADSIVESRIPASAPTGALHPADVGQVRDIVREAIDRKTRLRIAGRGTWLDAGRPVRDARIISLDAMRGIVDYTPGDLTLTARAGTSLAEIAAITAPHGQWLALFPWGGDDGSLGATVATATAGPMSGTVGTPRDIVIGLEAVTGAGDVVRGGGRVVKNVAGFDLTRLMVGAWGTLGVITEVSVRLRGLPDRVISVAIPAPNASASLGDLLARLRTAAIAPMALELVSAALAERLGVGEQPALLARLFGNAEAVGAQRTALGELADVTDVPDAVWHALRTAEANQATVLRLSSPVARFAETWSAASALAALGGGHAHASVLRSSARVILPNTDGVPAEATIAALRSKPRDTRIFERLAGSLWSELAPSPVADRLSRGVRAAFDPHGLLNPGILGEDRS